MKLVNIEKRIVHYVTTDNGSIFRRNPGGHWEGYSKDGWKPSYYSVILENEFNKENLIEENFSGSNIT